MREPCWAPHPSCPSPKPAPHICKAWDKNTNGSPRLPAAFSFHLLLFMTTDMGNPAQMPKLRHARPLTQSHLAHQPCSAPSRGWDEKEPHAALGGGSAHRGREFWSPGTQGMDSGDGGRLRVGMSLWPCRYPILGWGGCNWKRPREGPLIVGPEQGPPLPSSESNTALHGPSQSPRTVWGIPGPPPARPLCLSSLACPSGQE